MAIGDVQNQNDTPIGGEPYRAPILGTPTQGQTLVWSDADSAFIPTTTSASGDVVIDTVLTGSSYVDQNPTSAGYSNSIIIDFGSFNSFNAPSNGQFTLTVNLNFERYLNGGEAHVWVFALKNGVQIGDSELIILDSSRQRINYSTTVIENLIAGDNITFWLYRDASEADDGGLFAAPNTDGLDDAHSAFFEATRLIVT